MPVGRTMQYGTPLSRSSDSALALHSRMPPGFRRMIGMSHAPASRACLAAGQAVRVTPADESMTTRGFPPRAPPAPRAPGSSSIALTSREAPASLNPEAHQITASAPAKVVWTSSFDAFAKSSWMCSSFGVLAGITSPALERFLTTALTPYPSDRSCFTTSWPVLPVAPATAIVCSPGGASCMTAADVADRALYDLDGSNSPGT
mmetsp:Transcript_50925/g.143335  ORF Transcript_50925/g.143335 Transcript_50925/m.143335 type:complete len:204 (-) Transcript_50925:228-839(-)